ncbi:hypothetical protein JQI14_003493 [Escherichia coli]|nr:hypothetical protein [Escherichia coli]
MKNIETLLSPLCVVIRNGKIKSKQAAFNQFLYEILEVKKTHTWQQICEYINENTNSALAVRAYKNMTERAKKKNRLQIKKDGDIQTLQPKPEPVNPVKGFFSQREEKRKVDHDASASLAKFEEKYK